MDKVQSRLKIIDCLLTEDPRDNERFRLLLDVGLYYLSFSNEEAADLFDVSIPTVKRWRNGYSTPALVMRKFVFKKLANELLELGIRTIK